MNVARILESYHQLNLSGGGINPFYTKAGTRFRLEVLSPFLKYLGFLPELLDATGGFLAALFQGTAIESSRALIRCLEASGIPTIRGALWDVPGRQFGSVLVMPSTDKGSARVRAEVTGSYNLLKQDGQGLFLMHKDQGAKRYEAEVKALFGNLELLAKHAGWRLSRALKQDCKTAKVMPISFEVAGLCLQAELGVYAAGKLDPGTALLLESLDMTAFSGQSLLDMGCGYGMIALKAAQAGAKVTAIDDDVLAVRSTMANAATLGLNIACLHSDVDSDLSGQFEVVLMNPPFHVGKQVLLEVPTAFIAAAFKHLNPGGRLVLVANRALGYEALLEAFSSWEKLAENQRFKVLQAIRSS